MTYKQIRQLAYGYGRRLQCKFPSSWIDNKIAGIDWLQGFMKRHKNLTLHKPENTSLFRATAFSKTNVMEFFDNYECPLKSWKFTADSVYNIDETGVSIVVQSLDTVAQFGMKQIGQAAFGKRGAILTVCVIVSSVGNTVSPVFIFPRARFYDELMFGTPPGSLGLVNSPQSKWITGTPFLKILEHVKKLSRRSKEDCIILLMDIHESHCTLDYILYARENGITLVTFPHYCSHLLKPLDVGVMGPFKGKLCMAQHDWVTANPGKVIIHDLTSLTDAACQASFTVKNITAAFAKPSIWPFPKLAFSDEDFEPSSVTPMEKELCKLEIPVLSASSPVARENCGTSKDNLSPEDVCPFPKHGPRCDRRQRKKVKSGILTNSPIKDRIEQE